MDVFWEIFYRTIVLYVVLLIIFRLMGKREVGELSIIDLVIFVLIAEVAATAIEQRDAALWEAFLPMFLLMVIQIASSTISLKSKKARDLIEGDPTIIVRNGEILETEMRLQRYNLDDLFQQLREQQIGGVSEISYAFLEPSGNLSVFTKDGAIPVLPLVIDGEVQYDHLRLINKNVDWLKSEINKKNTKVEDIFYCGLEKDGIWVQLKTSAKTSSS
ncbi:DUF421 domain-containing protein [Chungangia koreensis]|uniref:DUF421 domain-containing protein n=1 Tax=Chungangia koreensis TaxID=752657 RepID=A0ABV8X3G5_9LACT